MGRFLVDEALPHTLARHLRAESFEVDDIRDLGLRGQPDERIFQEAQQRQAVLITRDLDFTNIFRFPPRSHHGIIILRLPNTFTVRQLAEEVLRSLSELSLTALARTIVIVEPKRTRMRRFDQ
ncbi:MAG TPA: DUF5615 family PIN-like protein [Methylomirabilota bacterium]|nr:DUF5615 family PIN-like protein [Methylomirabilota bacterium]